MRLQFTIFVVITISTLSETQRPSPCPEIFHYESQSRDEENKWYGAITLNTDEDLFGVWVKITLDRKAELLGNWFGASTSSDNKEFTIRSSNYHLKAGNPVQLRFYIQYDLNQSAPSVSAIKLNGKIICNANDTHNNKPNTRPSNSRPQQQNGGGGSSNSQSHHRPLNVDTDSYNKNQNEYGSENRPNVLKPSNTQQQSNSRPQSSVSNSRPSSQGSNTRPSYPNEYDSASSGTSRPVSNTRPSQSSNSNTKPTYQNNDYDLGSSGTNRPSSSNVNRPLNVDVDSYGTNQNEFSPAFGNVPENTQNSFGNNNNNNYNNRPSTSTDPYNNYNNRPSSSSTDNYNNNNYNNNNNNYNNRPSSSTDNYNTNHGSNTINLGTSTIQRPTHTTNGETDFFPGDFSVSRPIAKPETARPTVLGSQKPACGTVFSKPTPLITHGLESTEGQYPWHVALYHSQGIQLTYICGGSLISEDYVVTAAHCVTNPSTGRANNPQNILVYLGKTNLKKFGAEIQDRDVSKIIVHRDYNHTVFHNDIALLKLGRAADITNFVRPVCLWEGNTDLNSVLDQLGTVVGWGFDEDGQLTTSLMQTKMPVVSSIKCVYSNPDFFSRFTFDKSYCAGFRNGTTVCNGDSGGGMIFPKTKRNGEVLSWHLRGLVSVGVALQGKTSCDPSHYIVFTDVAKHLDWIRNSINDYY